MGTETAIVSACLLGRHCRYDGTANPDAALEALARAGGAVAVCPEMDGGLPSPRPRAEIVGGDGADVLDGRARVVTESGADVTEVYLLGARRALEAARAAGAKRAILKRKSPSCGVDGISDGTFSGAKRAGAGVTAALLAREGIRVEGAG